MKCRHTIFNARVGLVRIQQKSHRDTLPRTSVFAYGGICGSRSAFRCIRRVKRRRTMFNASVGPIQI
jgi:hypothetical protein